MSIITDLGLPAPDRIVEDYYRFAALTDRFLASPVTMEWKLFDDGTYLFEASHWNPGPGEPGEGIKTWLQHTTGERFDGVQYIVEMKRHEEIERIDFRTLGRLSDLTEDPLCDNTGHCRQFEQMDQ